MPRSQDTAIRRPTPGAIESIAADLGLSLTDDEREDLTALVDASVAAVEGVEHADEPAILPPPAYTDRPAGHRPDGAADPYNAWITRCEVAGADDGPLAGLAVGLKDTVALAGYELTLGSTVFEGFVPTIDATVVRRLLDAGATITGKQNMEAFGVSGGGDFSDFGAVRNPRDDGHLAGGSSSGSAAAVAAGDCDVSIGGDQAGSIRIPASWCGVVGLKPTTGLVPYTGVVPLNMSHDHVGPLARDVETTARTLEAIAGTEVVDGLQLDPRQPADLDVPDYVGALDDGVDGLRVGLVDEGFDRPISDGRVDAAVRDAATVYGELGATVEPVSIGSYDRATAIFVAMASGTAQMLLNGGVGVNHQGWYWTGLERVARKFMAGAIDQAPPTLKATLLLAAYLEADSGVNYYAQARNLALDAERELDHALAEYDALLLPTTPMPAVPVDPDLHPVERVQRSRAPAANTALLDVTRHPALSVPCATVDGLPVGLMLVGAHFDETTILRLGAAFEAATDWESR